MAVTLKRKIVSFILVASLLFPIGCYNTGTVTKEELKARVEQPDTTVCTKDSMEDTLTKAL